MLRNLIGAAVGLAIVGASVAVGPVETAQASTGCTESRATAASLASSGNFIEAFSGWTLNRTSKITLRYSSESGCVWGLYSDMPVVGQLYQVTGSVWLDRSRNGGVTWDKTPDRSEAGKKSSYTSTYNSIGYDSVRACGRNDWTLATWDPKAPPQTWSDPVFCTPWFFPGRLYSNANTDLGGRGFDSLSSPNGRYVLRMQTSDGNLVLYSPKGVPWATGTRWTPAILRMQGDGNLVVISSGNIARWASGTGGQGSYLQVQDDGNVVIYRPGVGAIWSTGTVGR